MPRKPWNPDITPEQRKKATERARRNRAARKAAGLQSKSAPTLAFSILRLYAEKYVRDYLKTHPCVDCGYSNPLALEFDHVRGKKTEFVHEIVAYIPSRYSIEDLMTEIEKCEIRCSNCHTIRHKINGYKSMAS